MTAPTTRDGPRPTGIVPPALCLILGGTRSGKSELAERRLARHPGDLVYVATGRADDADMSERIARHVARRGPRWHTVDAGADLAGALAGAPQGPALVDSLGSWVASWCGGEAVDAEAVVTGGVDRLVAAARRRGGETVVVSEEVGLSVHAPSALGRHFTDLVGLANQRLAGAADEVWLVVAGRSLRLGPGEDLLGNRVPGGDPQAPGPTP